MFRTDVVYCGDCLFVLEHDIPSNSVDLIYLDPPFFTGKIQKSEWSPEAMEISFEDSRKFWSSKRYVGASEWLKTIGVKRRAFASYLTYMQSRLEACQKVLKSTGSIFLHCDYRASHYLKLIMDQVFDEINFRNEIIWCYTGASSPNQKQFPRKHDSIFWYSNGEKWTFNEDVVRIPYSKSTLSRARAGEKGGRSAESVFHGQRTKRTLHKKGKIPEDYWNIPFVGSTAKERMGYPTQKPEALLKRIIKASSNEGDIVIDPFCGCGTAIVVAHKLGRSWIGIDINRKACIIMKKRFEKEFKFTPKVISRNLNEVLELKPIKFEEWVNEFFNAKKPSPDYGVDGITQDGVPIQTKALTNPISYGVIDAFLTSAKYHKKVPKPIKKMIIVSQSGFDDKARARIFQIEKKEEIKVELKEPKDLLEENQ